VIPLMRPAKRHPAASSTVLRPRLPSGVRGSSPVIDLPAPGVRGSSTALPAEPARRAWFARSPILPTATVLRAPTMTNALLGWLAIRWAWFKPRSIPFAVAFAGMIAILAATNALTEMAHREAPVAPIATKYQTIKIVNGPAGAQVQILDTARR